MYKNVVVRTPIRLLAVVAGLLLAGVASAQTALPGTLQAESYSSMSGVQIEPTSDTGGGSNVGYIDANDWMTYPINVPTAGWYTVSYRVASAASSGVLVLSQNAADISANTAVPNTGGWQTWTTVTSRVYLNAGTQNLTVFAKGGGFNLNWIGFARDNAALPLVRQSGKYFVDANGNRVNLRGTNLGNWLAMEFWMLDGAISTNAGPVGDQCTLENALRSRFGEAEKERLMNVYRDSWITSRDFDHMKAMGMNVVRVPFLYNVVENANAPYTLRADAWKYLDFAISEAEKRGMYTILDLHGAVGGSAAAGEQHDGCSDNAQLYNNATYRDRTKWLWDMIAQRYRDRSSVMAYDLLNEPWGTDANTLAAFSYELFNVVRAKDPNHVIFLPGHNSGIDAYGNPNSRGLTNVAFWMHWYPGLWGWNEVQGADAQANMYANWLHCAGGPDADVCGWNNKLTALNTPFLVGEFQPWTLLGRHGGQMARKAYDVFNSFGWAGTNWSYKVTTKAGSNGDTSNGWNWGMVNNSSSGGAYGTLNVSTASAAQIEAYFRAFASQPIVRNGSIEYWMNWQPAVGQRIEAEMFRYHQGVRMELTTDAGGGFNAGSTDNGDWMSYAINVPSAGAHTVQLRVASPYTGGRLAISRGGVQLATVNVPNTGGWQNWQTVSATVNLQAGQQDLDINVLTGGWNINWFQLNRQ